ncbi:maleylpyruvate isomerase family mycothiol-dependent enzyme [Glutamicibacter sp.]|uniref:maleylpyruvate isomerase family mycothiol-dependent enzyme n=1 Tax=Glutamicibacter sp. TaxID=1931995 RepID=UPI003D6A2047
MSKIPASEIWPLVHAERLALIDDLGTLNAEQWEFPSLCGGWSVHDVAAHLADNARATFFRLLVAMAKAGFSLDRQNDNGVAAVKAATPAGTLQKLVEVAALRDTPPVPIASRLVEEIAHGEDIRRAVGLKRVYPAESLEPAIRYQAATPQGVGGSKELASKVQLCSQDESFRLGIGPQIVGTRLELLMLVSGRGKHAEGLSGPGLAFVR